jgi:hypothetical protein
MNQALPNYDDQLGFRRIDPEDWLQPDIPSYFPGWKHQQWVQLFVRPVLAENVPAEIRRLFEAARGAIIYGWFFYPLLTLGLEQTWRVTESAARARCEMLGKREDRFFDQIKALVEAGIIPVEYEPRWQALRKLRNHSSHPKQQTIWDPGQAYSELERAADWINQLFAENNSLRQ